jgi:hypothetical protein
LSAKRLEGAGEFLDVLKSQEKVIFEIWSQEMRRGSSSTWGRGRFDFLPTQNSRSVSIEQAQVKKAYW